MNVEEYLLFEENCIRNALLYFTPREKASILKKYYDFRIWWRYIGCEEAELRGWREHDSLTGLFKRLKVV